VPHYCYCSCLFPLDARYYLLSGVRLPAVVFILKDCCSSDSSLLMSRSLQIFFRADYFVIDCIPWEEFNLATILHCWIKYLGGHVNCVSC
jgi:hypothetical protein